MRSTRSSYERLDFLVVDIFFSSHQNSTLSIAPAICVDPTACCELVWNHVDLLTSRFRFFIKLIRFQFHDCKRLVHDITVVTGP